MRLFNIICVLLVGLSLLGATSGLAASACTCPMMGHGKSAVMTDCHMNMAKMAQKQEKKNCCCEKMMGCKISFQMLGVSGQGVAVSAASAHYSVLNQLLDSRKLTPIPQPPNA